ncbi:hypothetical protein [Agrococcus baldri]|uniref:Uncharacterized protein n=1 Tax=Agrococcus baldri TaxID=153730 RepID=A0AA87UR13_9MICO|nr:hypothetical protein [Agrococcus baldri]GEK79035.1 hypothetical protein ABA31_03860 [Agrococcus baldri]
MARAKRTDRQAQHRLSWQQRHTISVEAERIMDHQEDLRNEVRGLLRII